MTADLRRSTPLDVLLWPLRLPGRLAADVGTLARAVLSLERTAGRHLPSIDGRAADLLAGLEGMRPALDTIAREVQSVVRLLPDPSDGPFARLRDTLTSS